jgi:hypothetical protein
LNWANGEEFVKVSLERDQDVRLDWDVVSEAVYRILSIGGKRETYLAMRSTHPDYFDLVMS